MASASNCVNTQHHLKRDNYRYSDLTTLQIQAVVEDALRDHLEAKNGAPGREHVMAAYLKSTERFSGLYKKLAQ